MVEQIAFVLENLPNLLFGFPGQRPGGLTLSILLAIFAVGLGFVIANGIGSGAESRWRLLRWLCRLYVEIFRGLPLLLLLLLVYQVAGGLRIGRGLTPRGAALLALTLYSAAYQAEIVRAGLRSVPDELVDSARTLGSNPWHAYRKVKIRYAVRVMLPAFTGQAISLFKDTSVVVILGVAELMTVAHITLGSDVANTPYWVALYMAVGLLYFIVAFSLSQLARRWERHAQRGDVVHSLANY